MSEVQVPGRVPGPAAEFREVAAGFTDRVLGAAPEAWDRPAPVDGWAARDVVRHLIEWLPGLLAGGSEVRFEPVASVDVDPALAWTQFADQVQGVLDDPATESRMLTNPNFGEQPLATAISQFFTADVFMHTWDLARATGQDETLDPDRCAQMLAGMEPMEDLIRGSGQFGPRVEVPADADAQTRLLGFIGRDPEWVATH